MPVSLWLRPETVIAEALDAAIAGYARQHHRTPFPAHLTLASGDAISDDEVSAIAAKALQLTLTCDGCLETPTFFQVFALRYHAADALLALRANALAALRAEDSPYIPHVSLTYGLPLDRDALLEIARIFDQPIRFDRLIAVRYEAQEPSQAAVAAWRLSDPLPFGA